MKALLSAIHEYNQSILKSHKPSAPGSGVGELRGSAELHQLAFEPLL
jgi:hypothetical protein